ncbi:LacI family DNA-binding transcriptional regulator, partial [Kutzneria sp. 744]|uniref:LacI family DNA-binding transcriptional regulator n=1 Tax=Kutzneria sp. (strain 744) TaxID=345341 RepID=UPI0003EED9D7
MTAAEPPPARPTLADVARAAGVSPATASRVLNGVPLVGPEKCRQVESALAALGYERQRAAWTSAQPRPRTAALVVCENGPRLFSDPYFARIVAGASPEAAAAGIQLVTFAAASTTDLRMPSAPYLSSGHVDGALLVSMHSPTDLDRIGVPIVVAGRPVRRDGNSQISS